MVPVYMNGRLIEIVPESDAWLKGGEKNMPEYPIPLEVERALNLVMGFGWKKVKEEIVGNRIVLTIEKTVEAEEMLEEEPVPS